MGENSTLPESLSRFRHIMETYLTKESHLKGIQFQPSNTDVIVSTAPKSGTTWVQQICHGLRSGGDMGFEEMSLVVPCLEMATDYGYTDLQAPQPYQPRMYKTHFWYHSCPKGAGKYIVVVRQPSDAAVSLYHFLKNWVFHPDQISMAQFLEDAYLNNGVAGSATECPSHLHHIMSWYPHRFDENVLWLHFEDLKQNLREGVRLIAEFLDVGSDDEKLQELVTYQATYEFMKKHPTKFDEHPLKLARNEVSGLPKSAGFSGNDGKVREGEVNASKRILPDHILQKIDQQWKEVITRETGYESYEAFREGINKELGRSFT